MWIAITILTISIVGLIFILLKHAYDRIEDLERKINKNN